MVTFRELLSRMTCFGILMAAASAPLANAGEYYYGDKMDIAEVISIDAPSPATCQVVTATMHYIDSKGTSQTVEFRQLASACSASG